MTKVHFLIASSICHTPIRRISFSIDQESCVLLPNNNVFCLSKGVEGTRSNWMDLSLLPKAKPVVARFTLQFILIWPTSWTPTVGGLIVGHSMSDQPMVCESPFRFR